MDAGWRTPSIRFLARRGEHHDAIIARFGFDGESSPTGIHLTRITLLGDKADVEPCKIMVGPSVGRPIVVWDNPERLDLFITEGIEDAASIAVATGLTCWAAGSAARVASLIPATKSFERVHIAVDNDFAGKRAFQRAREIRSDVIALDFGYLDANATIQKHGADAILKAIDRCFPAASIREAA